MLECKGLRENTFNFLPYTHPMISLQKLANCKKRRTENDNLNKYYVGAMKNK